MVALRVRRQTHLLEILLKIPQPEPHPRPFPEPGDPTRRPDPPPRPEPQPDGIPTPNPEPSPRPLGLLRHLLGVAVFSQVFAACDQWHLSVNSQGLQLAIFINDDDFGSRDRYRLRTRNSEGTNRVFDVPVSGQLTMTAFESGPLELTLIPPTGCLVGDPNPRTLNVSQGEQLSVTFEVSCSR
jgi:hypothetical protein